jgi:tetratricopeptide (TPR) repeat protein
MKLFLSSTYQDLHEHRRRVIEALERLRHNGAEIEWLGMEAFGARDDLPADACIQFVDKCDLYIGFLGVRYGSLDPKTGWSMTETEYRRAVAQNKPRLIFLIDEKNARVAPGDFESSPEGQQKLRALKEDAKKDRVVDFFTTPEDLAWKVTTALAQKLSIFNLPSPIVNLQSLVPFPPQPCFAHSYPLQAHFTGRARERAALSEWLTRGERLTEPVFVIEAIGGMGKSALAWYWLHNDILPLNTDQWSLAGLFWWSFYDERDTGRFLERAIAYVSGGKLDAQSIASDRDRVDALANLLRSARFLFVLDGFERALRTYARMDAAYRGDEVDAGEQNYRACADPNLGIFLRCLASGGTLTKVLITSRLMPRELDELAGVRHLALTGMDAADAVEFFHQQGIRGTRAEIEPVGAAYGFHPLSLRLLAGALKQDPRYRADIQFAPRVNVLGERAEQKILEFAYNSLPRQEQKLLSQLAAFRSSLKWETIEAIFAPSVSASDVGAKQSLLRWLGIASSQKTLLAMTRAPMTPGELAAAVTDLRERGLYLYDDATDTYDLHPLVRRYCYDRLDDRAATHERFRDYFATFPSPRKIQSLADLQPTIELYHHTVRAGRYDEAFALFRDRLESPTYFQLGAYQLCIELLRALFPDGEDKPPRLKKESDQAWTLDALANSYALAGLPRRAVPLFLASNDVDEKRGNKKGVAIGLGNVANRHAELGELQAAERNLRRGVEICREIKDEGMEATGRYELGRVLCYCGRYEDAEQEFAIAFEMKRDHVQAQGIITAYRALRALLMGDASAALAAARRARAFAEEDARTSYPVERDFIRAEWLMGAALVAARRGGVIPPVLPILPNTGDKTSPLQEAERHLQEALARDRAIGMVDHEAAILLEFAKLRFAQAMTDDQRPQTESLPVGGRRQSAVMQTTTADDRRQTAVESSTVGGRPSAVALMQEAFNFAHEALEIAERCEYRLQQADIHNFLAEYWLAEADRRRVTDDRKSVVGQRSSVSEAIAKAKAHAERAKELAWCDGAPYHYRVAYERAESLLAQMDKVNE